MTLNIILILIFVVSFFVLRPIMNFKLKVMRKIGLSGLALYLEKYYRGWELLGKTADLMIILLLLLNLFKVIHLF